jgi:predicted MFS family arabinose efflux permease
MEQQSIAKQISIGAFFGVLFAFVNRLSEPSSEPFLSVYGIGMLVGSAIGGIFLYMLLYRVWPKKK